MIDKLNFFRVRVIQPEKILAGAINDNLNSIMDLLKDPLDCDLIVTPYGTLSGCSKNQSLAEIEPLRKKVTEALSYLNAFVADTPIIINDITGLYCLDRSSKKQPLKIRKNKIRLGDKATIRFVDEINETIVSTPIGEFSEDLIIYYDPSSVIYSTVTKLNKNSSLILFNRDDLDYEVPFFSTNGMLCCPTIESKSSMYFDIDPKYHYPEEFYNDEYTEVSIINNWTIKDKTELNFHHPAFSYLISYDPDFCRRIFNRQVKGTVEKLKRLGENTKCFIGVSGGSDSTLALLVTYAAYRRLGWDLTNIVGISMPCFGTTSRTKDNAKNLVDGLGVSYLEINIENSVTAFLNDIGHPLDNTNVTYENAQARMRMMTLFGISNDLGGIVIGTGDLSEHWLGWCTFGGDDLAGYNPNCRVLKTTVLQIIKYLSTDRMFSNITETLLDIVNTPISPELVEGGSESQKTEDILGPYILHDIFITGLCLGWDETRIKEFARIYVTSEDSDTIEKTYQTNLTRFSKSQFKRSINIPGPKVGYLDSDILDNVNMPTDFIL